MTLFDPVETQESYIFIVNLQGYGRNDISVDARELRVLSAIFKNHHRKGGNDGEENITMTISMVEDDVQVNDIKAHFENGWLTMVLPKGKNSSPGASPSFLKYWVENSQNYKFHIYLPEYKMDEIRVIVQHLPFVEIKTNSPQQIIKILPIPNYDLKLNQIESSMDNDMLTIVVPKEASPKTKFHIVPIKNKL